jgi:hypothetical protein
MIRTHLGNGIFMIIINDVKTLQAREARYRLSHEGQVLGWRCGHTLTIYVELQDFNALVDPRSWRTRLWVVILVRGEVSHARPVEKHPFR